MLCVTQGMSQFLTTIMRLSGKSSLDSYPLEKFVPRFLNAEFDVDWKWSAAHGAISVMSWTCLRRNHDGFLLLRYEDLLQEPEQVVPELLHFYSSTLRPREWHAQSS